MDLRVGKKVYSIFFMVFIMALTAIAFKPNFSKILKNEPVNKKKSVMWDGADEYPLTESESDKPAKAESKFDRSMAKVMKIESRLENKITEKFKYRIPAIVTKNYYQKALGMDMTVSFHPGENDPTDTYDIIVPYDDEGEYLCSMVDDYEISDRIENVIDFKNYTDEQGINFIYFYAPGKFGSNAVYADHSDQKKKEIIKAFDAADVDYIDFDKYMPEDKDEYKKMFYKTDHHWLPSTAIYADKVLCEHMNEKYGYDLDTSWFEPDRYTVETIPDSFLGSYGRRVTEAYANYEDFDIYHPKFKPDLTVYNSRYDETLNGDIEETLYYFDVLSINTYNDSAYRMYGRGDEAYTGIHNNEINDGSRVMFISTSFAYCMYPYLSAVFEDIDVLDLRFFNGSVKAFIEKNKPDTIIMVMGTASYPRGDRIGIFDFR